MDIGTLSCRMVVHNRRTAPDQSQPVRAWCRHVAPSRLISRCHLAGPEFPSLSQMEQDPCHRFFDNRPTMRRATACRAGQDIWTTLPAPTADPLTSNAASPEAASLEPGAAHQERTNKPRATCTLTRPERFHEAQRQGHCHLNRNRSAPNRQTARPCGAGSGGRRPRLVSVMPLTSCGNPAPSST